MNINTVIRKIFYGYSSSYHLSCHSYNFAIPYKYMTISFDKEETLIPSFVYSLVNSVFIKNKEKDLRKCRIVIGLKDGNRTCSYVGFGKIMETILLSDFSACKLVKIIGKKKDSQVIYYGTNGALFDEDFNPLMVSCWKVKTELKDGKYDIVSKSPIVWVSPSIWQGTNDNVQRMIMKKFVPALFETEVSWVHYDPYKPYYSINLVIGECPFNVSKVNTPSVQTTDEELKSIVIDNIDDIVADDVNN